MEKPSSQKRGSKRWPFRRSGRPRPVRTIALLPTLITLGNGVCGVLAIFWIGQGMQEGDPYKYYQAARMILAGMIFDALDGFVARVTRTASSFGAQLDSLCDLVTFGVAPAFLVFAATHGLLQDGSPWARPVLAVCALFAVCAIIRLARFTVETTPDESSHREFAGLPSPAAAGVLASAVLTTHGVLRDVAPDVVAIMSAALPGMTLAAGVLMVSRVKYAHVVNRLLKGKRPFVTLIEIALIVTLAAIFREPAFFIAFFGYAALGPFLWMKKRVFRKPAASASGASGVVERKENLS